MEGRATISGSLSVIAQLSKLKEWAPQHLLFGIESQLAAN